MSNPRRERRIIYDLDYFLRGGVERRRGSWGGGAAKVRRSAEDYRQMCSSNCPGHKGEFEYSRGLRLTTKKG